MKTLDLFSKGEQTNRYLVLCDVPEREGEVTSKVDIEKLVREAIDKELEKTLSRESIEKALKAANAKLLMTCSGEASVPDVSCLVVAETTQKGKPYPEYLVGGVGDCRVYGIGKDKVHVAFSVPEKKDTRLGASEKLDIHFTRISGKTYPTLVALPHQGYAKVNEKNWDALVGAPNLPEKARDLLGTEQNLEGWIVIPGPLQTKTVKQKRPMAKLGLVVMLFLAVAGTGLWLRERRALTPEATPGPIAESEMTMSTILADALEVKELEVVELHDQLTEILEDNGQLIAALEAEDEMMEAVLTGQDAFGLDIEVSEIGSRFEEELNAHQSLLNEYKEEVATLREGLESYDELKEMLAEESMRYQDLAVLLEEKENALDETSTLLSSITSEHEETVASIDELRDSQTELTDKLGQLTESHQQAIADRTAADADLELLRTNLSEKEGQLASAERINEELSGRLEEVLAEGRSYEESNQGLALQLNELEQFRAAYEREHQLRLARDETLSALAVNIEGWRRAVESMERSREMLAQELAELRAAPRRRAANQMSSVKRIHLVSPGETLESIAHRYYSDFNKVDDLVEANHDVLKSGRKVEVGQALVIP